MLSREEMLSLIEAAESWERINDHVKELTDGYAVTNPEYTKISCIEKLYYPLCIVGPTIQHSDQNAIYFKFCIKTPLHPSNGLYKLLKRF